MLDCLAALARECSSTYMNGRRCRLCLQLRSALASELAGQMGNILLAGSVRKRGHVQGDAAHQAVSGSVLQPAALQHRNY